MRELSKVFWFSREQTPSLVNQNFSHGTLTWEKEPTHSHWCNVIGSHFFGQFWYHFSSFSMVFGGKINPKWSQKWLKIGYCGHPEMQNAFCMPLGKVYRSSGIFIGQILSKAMNSGNATTQPRNNSSGGVAQHFQSSHYRRGRFRPNLDFALLAELGNCDNEPRKWSLLEKWWHSLKHFSSHSAVHSWGNGLKMTTVNNPNLGTNGDLVLDSGVFKRIGY